MRVGFLFFCEDILERYSIEFQIILMQSLNVRVDLKMENQSSTSLFQLILLKEYNKSLVSFYKTQVYWIYLYTTDTHLKTELILKSNGGNKNLVKENLTTLLSDIQLALFAHQQTPLLGYLKLFV